MRALLRDVWRGYTLGLAVGLTFLIVLPIAALLGAIEGVSYATRYTLRVAGLAWGEGVRRG